MTGRVLVSASAFRILLTRASDSDDVLRLRFNYANTLLDKKGSSRRDVAEAVTILEDIVPRVRRCLGANHPFYSSVLDRQKSASQRLQKLDREKPSPGSKK